MAELITALSKSRRRLWYSFISIYFPLLFQMCWICGRIISSSMLSYTYTRFFVLANGFLSWLRLQAHPDETSSRKYLIQVSLCYPLHTIKFIPEIDTLFLCWNSQSFHLNTGGVSRFTTQNISWTGSFRTFIVHGQGTAPERVRKRSEFGRE